MSCQIITERELFRIREQFCAAADRLKPGDLASLLNVPAVNIYQGHCGDWANLEYAASLLDGLNPNAALLVHIPLAWPGHDN